MSETKQYIKYDGTNWREVNEYVLNFCKYGSDDYYQHLNYIKKFMEVDDCVIFYDDNIHIVCEEDAYIMDMEDKF